LIANIENMKKSVAAIGKNYKPMESAGDASPRSSSDNKDKASAISDGEREYA